MAPIHLLPRRDGPRGRWRGRLDWGMNIPPPFTLLECLFLFRGVGALGLDEAAFAQIASRIAENGFVKDDSRYNPERLTPSRLRDLFLDLLWDELKGESDDAAPRPDGGSPAPKRRKLQIPPRPTVNDAPRYLDHIKASHKKLMDAYVEESITIINKLQDDHGKLAEDIRVLEDAEEKDRIAEKQSQFAAVAGAGDLGIGTKNGVVAARQPVAIAATGANGINALPVPPISSRPLSPRPPPLPQASLPPQNPSLASVTKQDSAQLPQLLPTPVPAAAAPVPAAIGQPAAPQPPAKNVPPQKNQDVSRFPSGPAPGLQPPQGLPLFPPVSHATKPLSPVPAPQLPGEALQRPADATRLKPTPLVPPANPQAAVQGQLRWEPPYQPSTPVARHPSNAPPQQLGQSVIQAPQPMLQQQALGQPQHRTPGPPPSQNTPRPLQPQPVKPVTPQGLVPPQGPGSYTPVLQPAPVRLAIDTSGHPQNKQPLLAPNLQPSRAPPVYHGYPQGPPTHVAVSSPPPPVVAPPRPHPALAQPQLPRPMLHASQAAHTQLGAVTIPPGRGPAQLDAAQRGYTTPYPPQHPMIPDLVQQARIPGTPVPTPPARLTPLSLPPQTPLNIPTRLLIGSGTKWSTSSTPATPTKDSLPPRLPDDSLPPPPLEPLSPVQRHSVLSPLDARRITPQIDAKNRESITESPPTKRKSSRSKGPQRASDMASPSKPVSVSPFPSLHPLPIPSTSDQMTASPPRAVQPSPAEKEVYQPAKDIESTVIKNEVTTPQPLTEAGDTTADESVTSRRYAPRHGKRKHEELTPTPVQTPSRDQQSLFETETPTEPVERAPTEILWTRGFNRVCGSAIEQIIHHRFANMFAAPIRERDAPGYHKVILQPQDLKSIKAAISVGNRTASQAAAALPGGDPNTSSVWLPISEALLPPKVIINSGQLDRELAHMFANAIMYNPDSAHGPGPEFLVGTDESLGDGQEGGPQEGALGYKVDEFGVVNDARAMFTEVDKLLSELRSAEVRRTGGAKAGAATGTSTRQASVAQREASHAGDDSTAINHNNGDDADEQTTTEAEPSTAKRRRTTRG